MDACQEILFACASLTDLSTILDGLSPNIEIVGLDRDSGCLTKIDPHLQGALHPWQFINTEDYCNE